MKPRFLLRDQVLLRAQRPLRRAPLCVALVLAGCSVPVVTPDPRQEVSARFAGAIPDAAQGLDLDWWSRLEDPQLSALLVLAQDGSPDLHSAAANVLQARAEARETGADLYPSVTGQASATRSETDGQGVAETTTALLDASWEVDLFAKAATAAQASRLRARASEADFAGAYVTLSAEVADSYYDYRACKLSEDIYRAALASQRQTLRATEDLVTSGLSASSDRALARANVASAEISLETQKTDCAVTLQSIATLVGSPQARVREILSAGGGLPEARPFRVSGVATDVLRQRADVLSAELGFAAAMKDLKVAQAGMYPSLSLGGSVTLSDPTGWSFGPALSLPIFSGGAARASVRATNAQALVAAETYRATVLTAVEEVENALTRLSAANRNLSSAQTLVSQYQSYFNAMDADWQAGGISLLDREEARRQVQSARLTRITQRETLLRQWIALYKAVGGGWDRAPLPTPIAAKDM